MKFEKNHHDINEYIELSILNKCENGVIPRVEN